MRKLYYRLFPIYLTFFVVFAVLKFIIPATPLELLVKFYFLLNLLIIIIYFLLGHKLKLFIESAMFYAFSVIPIGLGIIEYGINSQTLAHIFAVILPIFGIPFGYYLCKNYKIDSSINIFGKIMKFAYISNILIVISFQLSVTLGFSRYPAIAPTGLIFSSLYYLGNRKWKHFFFGLLFIIISGKRASLVMTLFALIVFVYDLLRSRLNNRHLIRKAKKIISIATLFLAGVIVYLWNYTRYLNRFKLVFDFDITDSYSMYIATGGRSEEIMYIINFLNENPLRYIFGAGFGVNVKVAENFYRHYSHFSPLSYVLIFGMVFSIIIYLFFSARIIAKVNINHPLYFSKLIFAALFASSFLGSIVLNDVNFWVFYGMTIFLIYEQRKNKRTSYEINEITD